MTASYLVQLQPCADYLPEQLVRMSGQLTDTLSKQTQTFFYALIKPLLGHHESKTFFFPQIENYAARKNVTVTDIERMLASNLSYDTSL